MRKSPITVSIGIALTVACFNTYAADQTTSQSKSQSDQQSLFAYGTYKEVDGLRVFSPSTNESQVTPKALTASNAPAEQMAHTNTLYVAPLAGANTSTPQGVSPSRLRTVYQINSPSGAGKTIAIVDAYDDVNAASKLSHYSQTFGLPEADFQVVYASGYKPQANAGWAGEADLDVQMAHAMAPDAKIILVEAASASFKDMFDAVQVATQYVEKTGGVVSMSWSGSDSYSDTSNDSYFDNPAVYVASTGDDGGQSGYPATSPNVIAAGGTRIQSDNSQIAWSYSASSNWGGNGGTSSYEYEPSYQKNNKYADAVVNGMRGTPDLSADADPVSGVSVYTSSGWQVVGGTSAAAPILAGIIANANVPSSLTSFQMLERIYNAPESNWYDVTEGTNKLNEKASAHYDLVTGLGAPLGVKGFEG
ncbi:S53 family peptidase [Vibrio sp. S4M6]|uniref:S53 family peptidase n=1 Tax=Vibrio sinus TaxID=2946865 RepID=UPI00202A2045|nr:S53 family peptidase [Vibrio sinus]MCL9781136.1 S53 family peptidase [Vibrio sinus]